MPVQETAPIRSVSVEEGYRRWSGSYDSQPNPMLCLEQRYVNALLPEVKGRDVVDLGCGTGRWLEKLASRSPRTLVGVDSSTSMLARAAAKLRKDALLIEADCARPPVESNSADIILCSFVLSYISDIDQVAAHIRRIARSGANVFVTDVHPETAHQFGWQRGFRDGDSRIQVEARSRDVRSVLSVFRSHGLLPTVFLEVPFGEPEFSILNHAKKSHLIDTIRDHPAIYILQLTPESGASRDENLATTTRTESIRSGRIAIGPKESLRSDLQIEDGRIVSIQSIMSGCPAVTMTRSIDLSGFLIMPGLINAHDHLEFALFPRLASRRYTNFHDWATDVHRPETSPVLEHRAVPKETRLRWGGIRNLLCGVTTVCHHNPYAPEVFETGFPVRVVREFGWAHSVPIDPDFAGRHSATHRDLPFIMHVAEGVDRCCAEELAELDRCRVLNDRTVIVHGLALTEPEEIALINSRGAALIWCPSSNDFLFGSTHRREQIDAISRVALGSDSSLTACGDLLDEIRFARDKVGVSASNLYEQVTTSASDVLRLRRGEGRIRVGALGDLIAVRDNGLEPAETLASISYRDIELVIIAGSVRLASPMAAARLGADVLDGLEHLTIGGEVRWIRAPVSKLFESASCVLGKDLLINGRQIEP